MNPKNANHRRSVALMKFLAKVARFYGVDKSVWVIGGAVRNFVLDPTGIHAPIKDIDVVIDSIALADKKPTPSEWFAHAISKSIPVPVNITTNQYGVAILTIHGPWLLEGESMEGEVIEIANTRKESYGKTDAGKGYKPDQVEPATIEEDVYRREFTFNTLAWALADLAQGPDLAPILDITGCGLSDLKGGHMRCPSDPDQTFGDDPTRMIRVLKFLFKYNLKPTPDTEAAIKRNAPKLKNMPQNAVSKILLDAVLPGSNGLKAVKEMRKLGLLDVIAEMMNEDEAFRSTINNWASNQNVRTMLEMMDVGLPLNMKLGFMTSEQQVLFRRVIQGMDGDFLQNFVAALRQPGKVVDLPSLGQEFGFHGAGMGKLMSVVRDVLLDDPDLMKFPHQLEDAVRNRLTVSKVARLMA